MYPYQTNMNQTNAPRPAAAPAWAPPPAPQSTVPTPQWPAAPQVYAPQPPTSLARGTVVEIVDDRTVTMGTGEAVPTCTALVSIEEAKEPVPFQVWSQKRCDFAKQMLGRRVDIVFGLTANSRDVNTANGPTTIHNAVLRVKTMIPA